MKGKKSWVGDSVYMKQINSWSNHLAKCFVTFGMLTITLYHITEDPNKGKIDSTSLLQEIVYRVYCYLLRTLPAHLSIENEDKF